MLEDQFAFLDELRESGQTNMYGAGPYLEAEFGITKHEAKKVVLAWMRTFGDGTAVPKVRAEQAKQTGAV